MPEPEGYDEQDQSEVFDEDTIELESQTYGGRDNEDVFEALPDLLDVTQAAGDEDDDEAEIGEDLDDADLVQSARDQNDLEDDEPARGEEASFDRPGRDEVELVYAGDLNDLDGASSAAQSLESDSLSDSDLRELDYKDEFTRDEDEAAVTPPAAPR